MASAELTDVLLGIFNRRYLDETLPLATARARSTGRSLSVVTADIDRLRHINEIHGHATGNAVLQHAVSLMRSSLRRADWMARYGGQEFVVVLPETHIDGAYAAAERMRRRCAEKPFALPAGQIIVTASFGVACIDALAAPGQDINAMLQDAGAAVRESKRAGRNRVTCGPMRPVRTRVSLIGDA
jgi:two-component system cell cycle response regulator